MSVTHFVDLSPYTYYDTDVIGTDDGWVTYRPGYERLNVGWLDAPHDFTRGPTPSWLPDALLDIIAGPRINSMRGFHVCTFCPRPDDATHSMIEVGHAGGDLSLGHTEIRVPKQTGTMFAAPSLIWHYVTAHGYCPPADFVEAVNTYDSGWTREPSPWIPDGADRILID
jgi:hypothetical protein